ncbi:MAG: TrmH family RNA methyltransferase [Erysipelotrichaceae bacterium]|nr:TrmH family RNA methyltransferase [Erysipelotrichaceae bacterium]
MEKYASSDSYSYILGISLTIEALKKLPERMLKVYVSSKAIKNEQYEKLINLCKEYSIPVIEDDRVIDKLSVKENCYGIGVFEKYQRELTKDNHILLYQFTDYGELGTIMRSAVSFNFTNIILIDSRIDYFDPKVVRASMGSIFHLNIREYKSIEDYKKDYDNHLIPFISNGDTELKELNVIKPYGLIIPQVYDGLDKLFKKGAYIKHQNFKEISLSSLSSVVFNHFYQNVNDKYISDIKAD